ncbi:MAG TPA: tRNA preQ1(34) S-adenosylmethionine ribosyltransferase-isomerase QueA [Bacillota bacterium]|jgi:S-adenosylmethionine:tRNA ribosyltransferase-isomerase|nr:tRNA preQ1(34) S-adenosylmethionine ribosyltransferase-isomerase QueA [Bacillota bacterium]HOA35510.1 tRNA preQ1(34) S-adenosylmethionine ribosyltransferase-isomerase QueA [Bacillota bacterium]HOJ84426.1 tRNA preQ1(34) S-adenosylmethionine ribosyltransferase-isomerase QueA [Bacillota bacterium]HPZ12186.1 tRNA preQ1(34) S-adenosylmethionine ribosyltransferase-isomerase QueA [Bacillota bacterium]HQE10363.1 tRNA preQ1(34) S-adenosylmethionine ribosyltransferase-isomerase QueA [Bacillota bacteri
MEKTRLSDFDYALPTELIAQEPAARRDRSRMMVLRRQEGVIGQTIFSNFPDYLDPGDLLVLNNTRVIPARLLGRRANGSVEVELLLLHPLSGGRWTAMVRPGRKLKPGAVVEFSRGLRAVIEDYAGHGQRIVSFTGPEPLEQALPLVGQVPLPPYITEELKDPAQYQTIYASVDGSAAAPTAGFHFTTAIFESLQRKGIHWAYITLHIGPGTFQPVKEKDIRRHKMHREYYRLDAAAAQEINAARRRGGRIVAVGTTSCRVLEAAADETGFVKEREDWTDLFIYPGYAFKAVDALLTNFHLPRSTLLMLVCAFAGYNQVMEAYRIAVNEKYRFYSFGDCMLLL